MHLLKLNLLINNKLCTYINNKLDLISSAKIYLQNISFCYILSIKINVWTRNLMYVKATSHSLPMTLSPLSVSLMSPFRTAMTTLHICSRRSARTKRYTDSKST